MIENLRCLTCTKPNTAFGVGLVSRFMKSPQFSHLQGAKCILLYIRSTLK